MRPSYCMNVERCNETTVGHGTSIKTLTMSATRLQYRKNTFPYADITYQAPTTHPIKHIIHAYTTHLHSNGYVFVNLG